MIEGVIIKPLKKIPDERGIILHMLAENDEQFVHFGEIYFSQVYPGVVKGWHLHQKMILNYAVPLGMIKLVLCDLRKGSKTNGEIMELFIGEDNYCLVTIPTEVWNGFKGIGTKTALLANCSTMAHDPDEILRMDPVNNDLIKYNWKIAFK
ncbi:MAG: dTDP-4-dehydrorhamnose 3,5-epimerase family protein [Nanoarchaeota archaeon]|nr:dTDP-4-dehydrorhamnose 3,5-epimerase family protein [Nanoarchaeota archaeon]